jgi:hypothetical protein
LKKKSIKPGKYLFFSMLRQTTWNDKTFYEDTNTVRWSFSATEAARPVKIYVILIHQFVEGKALAVYFST